MRRFLSLLLALAAPAAAQEKTWQQAAAEDTGRAERVRAVLAAAGFRGVYAASVNGRRLGGGVIGAADGAAPIPYEAVFPLASFTEQVVAVMVLQQVESGRVALDRPAARYLPVLGSGGPTVRQLLQHRSGLRDPDAGGKDAGAAPGLSWCLGGRGRPGGLGPVGSGRSNSCDQLVLGALLERVTGRPLPALYAERVAGPTGIGALFQSDPEDARADAGWPNGPTAAERAVLVRRGAADSLVGTAEDVLAFDAALLDGRLLGDRARAELWRGDPAQGHQALGQRSFAAPLKGCAGPVRAVERRGRIGRFQLHNALLPQSGVAVVLLTANGDYRLGELREGRGASFDALSAAACG